MNSSELVQDLKIVSDNIFINSKGNALTSDEFKDFINEDEIAKFYITGADAVACAKSKTYNLRKLDYIVNVLSDYITSYDKSKGCKLVSLEELLN